MIKHENFIQKMIDGLQCLPGVGPKSAQRMAYYLLERDREGAINLASAIEQAIEKVRRCSRCQTFTENELCMICSQQNRNAAQLCVVETPVDVYLIEHATGYKGHYFVLMGHLSPLDGVGPDQLGLDKLQVQIQNPQVTEVIIATNPTVEGEATAHYIAEMTHQLATVTRLAHGVPIGGELEFIDGGTLAHAFNKRSEMT